jgi:hypothetical protein
VKVPISPNCVFDASLVPESCLELPSLPVCFWIRFGKLRPIYDMALRARRISMAPVLAITSLVARTSL